MGDNDRWRDCYRSRSSTIAARSTRHRNARRSDCSCAWAGKRSDPLVFADARSRARGSCRRRCRWTSSIGGDGSCKPSSRAQLDCGTLPRRRTNANGSLRDDCETQRRSSICEPCYEWSSSLVCSATRTICCCIVGRSLWRTRCPRWREVKGRSRNSNGSCTARATQCIWRSPSGRREVWLWLSHLRPSQDGMDHDPSRIDHNSCRTEPCSFQH